MDKQLRDVLIDAYLDYTNNYLSIALYAEHNGLLLAEALKVIDLGKQCHSHLHPDF